LFIFKLFHKFGDHFFPIHPAQVDKYVPELRQSTLPAGDNEIYSFMPFMKSLKPSFNSIVEDEI